MAPKGIGTPFTFPSPTGGLNLRDDVATLPPTKARELKNWLPDGGTLKPRLGYIAHSEGMGSFSPKTVAVHAGQSADKIIAVADGIIWDVSGATATSVYDGSFTSDVWVTANFNGYSFGVNGLDTPWRYDGSVRSASGFTGPADLTALNSIAVVRQRLWLSENSTATAWYGSLGGVTGALTSFDVGQIADGGSLQCVASWSRDAGDGADDVTVFIMSTGQVLVYSGDPASTFTLIGKYSLPDPIGRRCWVRVGGELILITRMGFIPLSHAMTGLAASGQSAAIGNIPVWGEIAAGVVTDVLASGTLAGWHAVFSNGLIIFNVPVLTATNAKQYVLNTRSNAWTTYDYPAAAFADNDGVLVFGDLVASGTVWKASGSSDNGSDIPLVSRSGYVRSPNGANWRPTMIRPYLTGNAEVRAIVDVDMDYEGRPFSGAFERLLTGAAGCDWGDDWDTDWAGGSEVYNRWQSVKGQGAALSVIASMTTQASDLRWNQTQVMVKPAGYR